MRTPVVFVLVLTMTLVSGCSSQADKPAADTAQPGQSVPVQSTTKAPAKVAEPVVIKPDPGPLAMKDPIAESTISLKDGVDKKEAQIAAGYYLRAHREKKLGDKYGDTSETYELLNQVEMMGDWILTYSRTAVDGKPASAYAVTIAVNSKTAKQMRLNEAP